MRRKRRWHAFRITVFDIGKLGEPPSKAEYFDTVHALTEAEARTAIRAIIGDMLNGGTPLPEWSVVYELLSVMDTKEEAA